MANTTKWTPNEKQNLFLKALKEADGALTLSEVSEIVGQEIKSGSINTLIAKGMVATADVVYECNIVRKDNGKVVGSTKKTVKAYSLVG
jgi:hypothetical protein